MPYPPFQARASVAEYLAQEVLDSCPPSQRDFLLRSAVLREFAPNYVMLCLSAPTAPR
jgi:ATP/maltotriose-dependent transcriptional regulator MalT